MKRNNRNRRVDIWDIRFIVSVVSALLSLSLSFMGFYYVLQSPPGVHAPAIDAVDAALAELELANVAYNVPLSVNIDDKFMVELRLSFAEDFDTLKTRIKEVGEKYGAEVLVSNRVIAKITGTDFETSLIGAEEQAVSRKEVTEWKWEVKPKKSGKNVLNISLIALLKVDGKDTQRGVTTYSKDVTVTVTVLQRLKSFVIPNWQWLWATLLIPVGAYIWNRWLRKKDDPFAGLNP